MGAVCNGCATCSRRRGIGTIADFCFVRTIVRCVRTICDIGASRGQCSHIAVAVICCHFVNGDVFRKVVDHLVVLVARHQVAIGIGEIDRFAQFHVIRCSTICTDVEAFVTQVCCNLCHLVFGCRLATGWVGDVYRGIGQASDHTVFTIDHHWV